MFYTFNFEDLFHNQNPQILEQCKQDAIKQFGEDYKNKEFRQKLTPEKKKEVLEFLIQQYYRYVGF